MAEKGDLSKPTMPRGLENPRPRGDFSPETRDAVLEAQWKRGGHGIASPFADISTNWETND